MKFKQLREANLSKAQINKVHDKADDLPKSDFIKRYGKEGDAVRFATATNIVKKQLGIGESVKEGGPGSGPQHKDITITRDGKTKTVKGAALSVWKKAGWVKEEVELDEGPKFDIKKIDNGGIYTHGLYYNRNLVSGLESTDKKYVEKIKKMVTKNLTMGEEVELDEVHFSNRGEPPAPKGMHKLRSGRDIPSTPQVDKIHQRVVAMTDRNDHSGARIEIAKQVGDKQLVQIFTTLQLMHDKYSGAVGNQAIELRNKFEPVLNNAIDRKFGKYADVIRDGL